MTMTQHTCAKTQKGAALIVSLFLLLLLTIIGITSMRATIVQERMTSNERARAVATHAAESALRDAEASLAALQHVGDFGARGIAGDIRSDEIEPDLLDSVTNWNAADSQPATNPIAANVAPRSISKQLGFIPDDRQAALNQRDYEDGGAPPGTTIFRVSARGVGLDGTTEVILQTHFGARPINQ